MVEIGWDFIVQSGPVLSKGGGVYLQGLYKMGNRYPTLGRLSTKYSL